MTDPLVETWLINARINLYLLAALKPASLDAKPSSSGRSVGQVAAHIHNVRLMWLKVAAPDLHAKLDALDNDSAVSVAVLTKALDASSGAIVELVTRSLAAGGRVKNFKPHVHAFVGYLISHESHHRGQMALALKQSGVPLDKKVAYGMWEWGSR